MAKPVVLAVLCMQLSACRSGAASSSPAVSYLLPMARCLIPPSEGSQNCYRAKDVRAAQSEFPRSTVDPSRAVWAAARLRLRQVIVTHGDPRTGTGPAVAITYLYGTPSEIVPPSRTAYVIVIETPTQHDARPPEVSRDNLFAAGRIERGPWQLTESLRGRGFIASVQSNMGRDVVVRIGRAKVRGG